MLQIEMEAQYAVQEEDMQKIIDWSLPSMLFRYGLSNNVELQLNAPLVLEKLYEYDHLVRNSNRFSNIQLGTSLNLWKQKNILPETAFMARVILPINKNENSNKIGEILALNFSNAFLQNFALNYNIGYVHETDGSNAGYYILNLTYNLNQNVHFFIENFSDFKGNSSFSQNLIVGGGGSINANLCLDFSVANGLNHNFFYSSLRLTWLIKTNKS